MFFNPPHVILNFTNAVPLQGEGPGGAMPPSFLPKK